MTNIALKGRSNFPFVCAFSTYTHLLILAIGVSVVFGCGKADPLKNRDFIPLRNGFGYGLHSKESYPMHQVAWADFSYEGTNKVRKLIWKYLNQVASIQISNDIAIFLGDKSIVSRNGDQRLSPRLIAFEAPDGPPMDITAHVFQKWSAQSGVPIQDISPNSIVHLSSTNGVVQLGFGIVKRNLRGPGTVDALDGNAELSWSEITSIMHQVRTNGRLRKEPSSGVDYLEPE